jgi:hypothetical protein
MKKRRGWVSKADASTALPVAFGRMSATAAPSPWRMASRPGLRTRIHGRPQRWLALTAPCSSRRPVVDATLEVMRIGGDGRTRWREEWQPLGSGPLIPREVISSTTRCKGIRIGIRSERPYHIVALRIGESVPVARTRR